jgi:anhydro-N-acetylmuramic acid kinase
MLVAGLMSGTSVDGIDVALAEINGAPADGSLRVQQVAYVSAPWPDALRATIFKLFHGATDAATLCRANFAVAGAFVEAIQSALTQAGLSADAIDLIGSHGQTIWHDVQANRVTSTLQIGDPSVIAAQSGVTTVGNFRTADVALGGQGAPLTSTFDWRLLRPAANLNGVSGGWRAVQNIGGIGNVTLLPPVDQHVEPLAFDTGPGNALIDWAASEATDGEWRYDLHGELASEGRADEALLATWLGHPYFAQPLPKTTGRELFSRALAQGWQAAAYAKGLTAVDLVATLTALTAASIADAYVRYAPGPLAQVVIGGGGARNPVLMEQLATRLEMRLGRAVELCTHEALGIDADAKEALAFALLAYLTIHGWPGNLPSCTGARRSTILGQIAPGVNYTQLMQQVFATLQAK